MDAHEIIKGLWIGNEKASKDKNFFIKNKIQAVVNATKHIPFSTCRISNEIECMRIPVNDPGVSSDDNPEKTKMMLYLPSAVYFINKNLNLDKHNVLVHCHAGIQRSATIVAAYLMWKQMSLLKRSKKVIDKSKEKHIIFNKVIKFIIERRKIAFYGGKSINFHSSLKKFMLNL